ncbi:hypothetical protein AHF37_00406 [Paragonimus kellicotti]|nr:hypothetical protein AHF37_00406 [Paragonimus kellicotti]
MYKLLTIFHRSLRTQLVGCERDFEYLAKLHCLRQAFDFIFDQPEPTIWICAVGKLSGFRLLHGLGYPINDFKEAYERLLTFVNDQKHNPNSTMAEELTTKGVKVINFYDVVIDLMLLDSLELLSDPPASVLSVTRHRWLSDNFKRVALDSTIWTILLAKRKLLKYADGFYAHYYTLVGTVTPALAWGFLGPDEGALRMCNRFREIIVAFLREAFVCYHKPRATEVVRRQGTPINLDLEEISRSSNENSHADNKRLVSNFESVKPAHTHLNSSDDVDEADDGDDNSTIIYQAPVDPDLCNHISHLSRDRDQTGLRYTTVPELAEDLYCLFIDCMAQLARMFREEARLAMNPQPDDWNINPEPPILRVF